MRKILLSFLAVLFLLSTRAQVSESEASIAQQLVSKNSAAIGLTADDLNNYLVSATYVTREGIRMVYLQQSYQGIPVYNKIHVLAFRDDKVVSVAGDRIRGISKLVNTSSTTPTVDAGSAVRTAFAESSMMTNEPFVVKDIVNRKLDFGRLNASLEIDGILLCRINKRTRLSQDIVSDLRKRFEGKVYQTMIRENIKLAEAPSFGKPITLYDSKSSGAEDYRSLAMEMIKCRKGK